MERDDSIPTEREWLLMEAVWDAEEQNRADGQDKPQDRDWEEARDGNRNDGQDGARNEPREPGLTAAEILARLGGETVMTVRTERVLLHHLCKKGLLAYTVDTRDSRVYHYTALRSREACRREKSRAFIDAYFRGDGAGAAAAFLRHTDFSDAQLQELEDILEARKGAEPRGGSEPNGASELHGASETGKGGGRS